MKELGTIESNNTEANLERKRQNILGVIFLIFSISAILNLPKLLTLSVRDTGYFVDLFNGLLGIVTLVIVIQVLKRKPMLNWLMYLVVVGVIGSIIFWAIESKWIMVVAEILLGIYVVYYVKAPISENYHRIANYMLLPLAILVAVAGSIMHSLI